MKRHIPLILLVACSGCMNMIIPKTEISGSIHGQPFSYVGPKDQTIGYLSVSTSTNGEVSLTVSNLTARMNPEVITTTADAQIRLIEAIKTAILDAAKSAK